MEPASMTPTKDIETNTFQCLFLHDYRLKITHSALNESNQAFCESIRVVRLSPHL